MGRILKVLGIVLALLVVAIATLPFLISADRFRPMLESRLSAALGRRVAIGSLRLSVPAGGVSADSLSIDDDPAFGRVPFLQAKSLKIGVEIWPLITSRQLNVRALTIDAPQVILLQGTDGRWNYSSLGAKVETPPSSDPQPATSGGALDLSVRLIRITDGRFSIGKTAGSQKPLVLEGVDLQVRDFAPSVEFPFSVAAKLVGGGDIKLEGAAGPIESANVAMSPFSVTLNIAKLNLAAALAGTAPDLGGTAAVEATTDSRKGQLTTKAKVRIEGLELVKNGKPAGKPVQFDFVNEYDLNKRAGILRRGNISVGTATASLTGTYAERGGLPVLSARFLATKAPVPELAELLPALKIELPKGSRLEGGTASADFVIEGPTNQLVAGGSLSLDKTRLANFDLGTKMAVVQVLAGIKRGPDTDIEVLSAKLKHTAAGTTVENLHFVATGIGELNGSGTISPSSALSLKMSAKVQTTRSALLSKTAVPFFVQGTASDPVFRADLGGLARSQAETLLESEAGKRLKGRAGEAAAGILDDLLGRTKKKDEAK